MILKSGYKTNNKHIQVQIFSFEILFILFILAGFYKADPRLAWVPVDLTALFFILSIISGLVIIIRRGIVFKRRPFYLFLLYVAFALYVLLSYIWTPGKIYATQKTLYIWTLVLWALAAPALVISVDSARLKRLGILYIMLSLMVSIEAIVHYIQAGKSGFITVFGSNYLGLGRVAGIAFILSVAYFVFWSRNIYKKIFSLAGVILFLWVLLIGGGRGPLLAAGISVVIPLVFSVGISLKRQAIIIKRKAIPMLIIVLVFIMLIVYIVESGQITQTINRLLVLTEDDRGASAGARLQYFADAFEYWKEAPILGYGIGSWPIINSGIDKRSYPHNIILEILVELGFIGVVLFLTLIFYAFSFLSPLKSLGDQPIKTLLMMLIVYMLINSMVSGDISDNRLLFTIIGLMPAALFDKGREYKYYG